MDRRAPVQGDIRPGGMPSGTVNWAEHEEAWQKYAERHGRSQSAERIAERAGFSFDELTDLLGHEPKTWRPV